MNGWITHKFKVSDMPFSIVPFLLLIIPILEIATFIVVGGEIGVLYTFGLILLTAILGSILLRWQGFQILGRLQSESQAGKIPSKELVHGAMILVAGVLLLTPGFVTDTVGFLLFVPGIRDVIWSTIASKVKFTTFGTGFGTGSGAGFGTGFGNSPFEERQRPNSDDIVDLDPDEYSDVPNADSPWGDGDSSYKLPKK